MKIHNLHCTIIVISTLFLNKRVQYCIVFANVYGILIYNINLILIVQYKHIIVIN